MLKSKLKTFKEFVVENRKEIAVYAIIGGVGAICGYLHYTGYKKGYMKGCYDSARFDEIYKTNLDVELGAIMKDMIKSQ